MVALRDGLCCGPGWYLWYALIVQPQRVSRPRSLTQLTPTPEGQSAQGSILLERPVPQALARMCISHGR